VAVFQQNNTLFMFLLHAVFPCLACSLSQSLSQRHVVPCNRLDAAKLCFYQIVVCNHCMMHAFVLCMLFNIRRFCHMPAASPKVWASTAPGWRRSGESAQTQSSTRPSWQ
jgi:hypothetical protein